MVVIPEVLPGAALSAETASRSLDDNDSILILDSDNLYFRPEIVSSHLKSTLSNGGTDPYVCHSMYVEPIGRGLSFFTQERPSMGRLLDAYSKVEFEGTEFVQFRETGPSPLTTINVGMYFFQRLFDFRKGLTELKTIGLDTTVTEYSILKVLILLKEMEDRAVANGEVPSVKVTPYQLPASSWKPAGTPFQYETLYVRMESANFYEEELA